MQPRQIYASTVTRRDRRWTRRRGHGMRAIGLLSIAALAAALVVLATLAPSLG
ncbi:MAG: hypothetical protein Q8O56_00325 [Solirubrobacteraceae bacterium]|nr:hypothetical protein [Solirubrobacteraceae bacterium]